MLYKPYLERELDWQDVDSDLKKIIRLFYQIPGFASYGVSCSGHFHTHENSPLFIKKDFFWPKPEANLGMIGIIDKKHVINLIDILYLQISKLSDSKLVICKNPSLWMCEEEIEYHTNIPNLRKYSFSLNNGNRAIRFDLKVGDDSCLHPGYFVEQREIPIENNKKTFEKSKQRCHDIKNFWKGLEKEVQEFCIKYDFNIIDWEKKEFK